MASVFDVASYILSKADLDEGDGITHLKLQKLVYYAQGFSVVLLGRPLFPETIEAWTHGPVVPELYNKYRHFGPNVISQTQGGTPDNLTTEEKTLIDDVFSVYGEYSASKLRNLTHNETPWMEAENKEDVTISIDSLRSFFPSLLENGNG